MKEPRLTDDDEALWLEAAQQGDLAAFERLYRRYARQVHGICRRLLDTNEDAEDMTQRVFVRAWRNLGGFRGKSRLGTWLRRIAVNLMIDERQSRWRRQLESVSDDDTELLAERERTPGTRVDLDHAICRLPAGPRRVLVLHDIEGYTHAEIAQLMGVTAGTTKTQLFRARRALREILG